MGELRHSIDNDRRAGASAMAVGLEQGRFEMALRRPNRLVRRLRGLQFYGRSMDIRLCELLARRYQLRRAISHSKIQETRALWLTRA